MSENADRVIIIDHDPAVLDICQQVLQQAGYTVQPHSPVELVLSPPLDVGLILLDVNLLTQDDCSLLRQLRHIYPTTPIILLLPSPDNHDGQATGAILQCLAQAVALGIQHTLFKPLNPDDLHRVVTDTIYQQRRRQAEYDTRVLQRLRAMSQTFAADLSTDQVYTLAAEVIRDELQADWVSIMEWQPQNTMTRVVAYAHPPGRKQLFQVGQGQMVPPNNTFAGWVIQHRQSLLINRTRPVPEALAHLTANLPPMSALSVPIMVGEHLLGLINTGKTHDDEAFGEVEQELLLLLADQIAAAVGRAQRLDRLRFVEACNRALMEHITDAVWLLDADGQQIFDANPAAERLSGYSHAALLKVEPRTLLVGLYHTEAEHDGQTTTLATGNLVFTSENGNTPEPTLCMKNGQSIPVVFHVDRVARGDEQLLLVLAHDASASRDLSRQLMQDEKFAAIRRLVAGIAHEINNPLQAVHNSLHLLISRAHNGDNEKRQRYLVMAQHEVEHLISIVKRILDIYQPSREGVRTIDQNDLLHNVLTQLQPVIHSSSVQLVEDLQSALPYVLGISSHLRQVYDNLLHNALESMPNGGLLTVRTFVSSGASAYNISQTGTAEGAPDGRAQPSAAGDMVVVEVSDTGRGIAPDELAKIFEPFYTTRSNGVGLGLAISYDIVEQHGGKLSVRSVLGSGTTFQIYLPVASVD
jgi:two-component system NtrC family sensor kinase